MQVKLPAIRVRERERRERKKKRRKRKRKSVCLCDKESRKRVERGSGRAIDGDVLGVHAEQRRLRMKCVTSSCSAYSSRNGRGAGP